MVVDPGDAVPVARVLAQEGLELTAILITHHHADHQGGVESLSANCQLSVFGPAAESITGLTHPLQGGEVFELPALGTSVSVISVPGHTSGHLAYLMGNRLFCGDTIFGAGCGRLFEGTPAQMAASLRTLASLPDETEVYCAHEYTEMKLRFAVAVETGIRTLAATWRTVSTMSSPGTGCCNSGCLMWRQLEPEGSRPCRRPWLSKKRPIPSCVAASRLWWLLRWPVARCLRTRWRCLQPSVAGETNSERPAVPYSLGVAGAGGVGASWSAAARAAAAVAHARLRVSSTLAVLNGLTMNPAAPP